MKFRTNIFSAIQAFSLLRFVYLTNLLCGKAISSSTNSGGASFLVNNDSFGMVISPIASVVTVLLSMSNIGFTFVLPALGSIFTVPLLVIFLMFFCPLALVRSPFWAILCAAGACFGVVLFFVSLGSKSFIKGYVTFFAPALEAAIATFIKVFECGGEFLLAFNADTSFHVWHSVRVPARQMARGQKLVTRWSMPLVGLAGFVSNAIHREQTRRHAGRAVEAKYPKRYGKTAGLIGNTQDVWNGRIAFHQALNHFQLGRTGVRFCVGFHGLLATIARFVGGNLPSYVGDISVMVGSGEIFGIAGDFANLLPHTSTEQHLAGLARTHHKCVVRDGNGEGGDGFRHRWYLVYTPRAGLLSLP